MTFLCHSWPGFWSPTAFENGYRRYEWKCDSLNVPLRSAALRFGFQYEGLFRQALIYKGRNRDTAWYSIIDSEWPEIAAEFQRWLHSSKFDDDGQQLTALVMPGVSSARCL